jgi:hypothetical protein
MVFPRGAGWICTLKGEALRSFRPRMSLVFQDPYSSLNPRMTVRDIIAEPLVAAGLMTRRQIDARVREIAARCKLNLEHLRRFPACLFGRAAPAHLHRPGAGRAARFRGLRRERLGAGRVDPGRDREPAEGSAGRDGRRLPVHRA